MMRRGIPVLMTAFAAALVLSGCAGNSSAQSKEAEDEDAGLLWSQLEFLTQTKTQEELDLQAMEEEDLVAQCMKEQGFDYQPGALFVTSSSIISESVEGPEMDTMEFAKLYGYGIVDSPLAQYFEKQSQETEMPKDPNEDYVNSLSPEESSAYWLALTGPGDSPEDIAASADGNYVWDWTKFGCQGWATEQMEKKSPTAFWEDPEFAELASAVRGVWDTVVSDPEMEQLEAEWSSCMIDSAYTGLPNRTAARDAMRKKYDVLSGCEGNVCTSPPKDKQEEFQQEEIKQAVADQRCAQKVNYFDRRQQITDRIEKEIVDRYRNQIDAAALKYGGK